MNEVDEQTQPDQQTGQAIGIYPTPLGVALEITTSKGEKEIVMLAPDDAVKIAGSITVATALFRFQQMMQQAAEQAEFERVRQNITKGIHASPISKQ